jgi:NAD(P)-dependent dehydrogenase (short-subunit alcohol dehydrogenase family)
MSILRRHRPRTSLAGRAVLITGAARGIGAELARKAAARGARVALVGLEPEELARVADELGPEHLWVEADVTDPEALKAAVQRTVDTFGGLDVVVANAGIVPLTTVMTSSAHALARTIEVNLIGAMLTTHAALPAVAERKGHVLLISSAAAFTVLPGLSAYCAAKAGVERFGDALRLEVAHRGVTVASAHPTWIDTDMVRDTEAALPTFAETRKQLPGPLGAYTSVEACAEALVENLETRRRRVFVPGSVGVISAVRQVVTGAVAEKVMLVAAKRRVPQLERDIAALNGQEFGRNSVGDRGRTKPAA